MNEMLQYDEWAEKRGYVTGGEDDDLLRDMYEEYKTTFIEEQITKLEDQDKYQALETLKYYCDDKGIEIDEEVFKLTVEDVLNCLADRFKYHIAEGKMTVEDCIDIISSKLEIDFMTEMEAVIKDRILKLK